MQHRLKLANVSPLVRVRQFRKHGGEASRWEILRQSDATARAAPATGSRGQEPLLSRVLEVTETMDKTIVSSSSPPLTFPSSSSSPSQPPRGGIKYQNLEKQYEVTFRADGASYHLGFFTKMTEAQRKHADALKRLDREHQQAAFLHGANIKINRSGRPSYDHSRAPRSDAKSERCASALAKPPPRVRLPRKLTHSF